MLKMMIDMYKKVKDMVRSYFAPNSKQAGFFNAGRSFQRKASRIKTAHTSKRRFHYEGVDGVIHSVRVGKPFPVRPKGFPFMALATQGNRGVLTVRV